MSARIIDRRPLPEKIPLSHVTAPDPAVMPLDDQRTIFQRHWWLDAVAAGQWDEIQVTSGGRVVGCLPIWMQRKGPVRKLAMPPFTRTLGPIIDSGGGKPQTRFANTTSILRDLLAQLPRFDLFDQALDPSFSNPLGFLAAGFRVGVLPTLRISPQLALDEIWAGMRDKTRNLIRRAGERLHMTDIQDPEEFTAFYIRNLQLKDIKSISFGDFRMLYAACRSREQGRITACLDEKGETHAAIFTAWDSTCSYFLLATRNRSLAHLGALDLLVWDAIQHAHSRGIVFDLDGITTPSRMTFLTGFGGQLAMRYAVRKTRLPYAAYFALRSIRAQADWNDNSILNFFF